MNAFKPSPAVEALSVNVVVARAFARLSQAQLAERAGISRPTLSKIERGVARDVSIGIIQRIADALGTDVAELLVPPPDMHHVESDEEIAQRIASATAADIVDADVLLAAIDEADATPRKRYSNAGRPRVARQIPPRSPAKIVRRHLTDPDFRPTLAVLIVSAKN